MALRFTNSKDGIPRVDIRVTVRLSADDLAEIKRLAKDEEEPWRKWLTWQCESGLRRAILDAREVGGD